jgi:LmbE family N-acetylglucosaminyl deacetylase
MTRRAQISNHAKLFGAGLPANKPSCLVIVAHPDDEIVGAGCLLSRLDRVVVIHLTGDGTSTELEEVENLEIRKEECIAALSIAQVPRERVVDLDLADLPYHLTDLTKTVTSHLQRVSPEIVLTHAYEGGHPDHDATAFASHASLKLLQDSGIRPPVLFEMALHPSTDGQGKVIDFLPNSSKEITTLVPDREARDLKRKMYACFETQRDVLESSPLGPERFRESPDYDLRVPSYDERLHYENFYDDITLDKWQSLASEALRELFGTEAVTH